MSFKLFCFAVLSIILYTSAPTQAGVLRTESSTNLPIDKSYDPTPAETQTAASDVPESATIQNFVGEDAHSRDEDATVKIAAASLDPAPGTLEGIEITLETIDDKAVKSKQNDDDKTPSTDEHKSNEGEASNDENDENKNKSALSRDEVASIKANAHESDDLAKEIPPSSVESIQEPQKSSKLLLLSTPRLAREQEENVAEPEDIDINTAVSTDETTELSIEVHTETEKSSEEDENKPGFITRVRDAIFGKKSEDEATKSTTPKSDEEQKASDVPEKQEKQDDQESKKQEDTAIPATIEQTPAPHNNNAAAAILIETEPAYVLLDSDVAHLEHLGSFTHIDSDEHLQPIVHSVEEVPSHFEEPLLFTSSYVHAW